MSDFDDDAAVFLDDFGVDVTFSGVTVKGIPSTRDFQDAATGAQLRRQVVRIKANALGALAEDDHITVDGATKVVHRVDGVEPDLVFDEIILAG